MITSYKCKRNTELIIKDVEGGLRYSPPNYNPNLSARERYALHSWGIYGTPAMLCPALSCKDRYEVIEKEIDTDGVSYSRVVRYKIRHEGYELWVANEYVKEVIDG